MPRQQPTDFGRILRAALKLVQSDRPAPSSIERTEGDYMSDTGKFVIHKRDPKLADRVAKAILVSEM
jgi:hypothetical protein